MHVFSNDDLVLLGHFASHTTAAAYTAEKRRNETLRPVGFANNPKRRGGLEILHCNGWRIRTIKEGNHEKKVSRFCWNYFDVASWNRGPYVDEREADAEMTIQYDDGEDYFAYVEMDCGSMTSGQVKERWKKYEGCQDHLLIITAPKKGDPKKRLDDLIRWSEVVYPIAYFATLEDVTAKPYGKVYWHAIWDEDRGEWTWAQEAIDDPDQQPDSGQVEMAVSSQE